MFKSYRDNYGWSVIPLNRDKTPAVKSWKKYQDARPADAEVEAWDQRVEKNIGVVCGAISGLVVLDVDDEAGWDAIAGQQMPPAVAVVTRPPLDDPGALRDLNPRGRAHFYFRHPGPGVRIKSGPLKSIPGIDIKADGGYVAAPPSWHLPVPERPELSDGWAYEWMMGCGPDEADVALIPHWLLDHLTISREGKRVATGSGTASPTVQIHAADQLPEDEPGWVARALAGVSGPSGGTGGERDHTATRLAGYFLHFGIPAEHVETILLGWDTRNSPPLGTKDIKKVVRSVAQAEGRKPARPEPPPPPPPGAPSQDQLDHVNLVLEMDGPLAIVKVEKFSGDNPNYVFHFSCGARVVMSPATLSGQAKCRVAIFSQTGRNIAEVVSTKKDPYAWRNLIEEIDAAAEHVSVGHEATAAGSLVDSLQRYLDNNKPDQIDDDSESFPDIEPFVYQGRLYIQSHHFMTYLHVREMTKISAQQLAQLLRVIGWEKMQFRLKGSGERIRAWLAPSKFAWTGKKREVPEIDNIIPFPTD